MGWWGWGMGMGDGGGGGGGGGEGGGAGVVGRKQICPILEEKNTSVISTMSQLFLHGILVT